MSKYDNLTRMVYNLYFSLVVLNISSVIVYKKQSKPTKDKSEDKMHRYMKEITVTSLKLQ